MAEHKTVGGLHSGCRDISHLLAGIKRFRKSFYEENSTLMRGLVLALMFVVTIAYMVDATNSPFLYFRF